MINPLCACNVIKIIYGRVPTLAPENKIRGNAQWKARRFDERLGFYVERATIG